ncbi:MAG: PqqD family protein [Desulfosoma sp.]
MSKEKTIGPETILRASQNQVSTDLQGETVILDLKSGVYYGLDAIGTEVWRMIQKPRSVKSILEALLNKYEVAPDRCEMDLVSLLEDLHANNLVVIHDQETA